MATTFEAALAAQLEADPQLKKSMFGKRVQRVLNAPAKRKARALKRMEEHARVHLGKSATQNVDWQAGSIDWNTLLEFLKMILPIILALFGI